MELEAQWWTGQLAADIHQALRYKVPGLGGSGGGGCPVSGSPGFCWGPAVLLEGAEGHLPARCPPS